MTCGTMSSVSCTRGHLPLAYPHVLSPCLWLVLTLPTACPLCRTSTLPPPPLASPVLAALSSHRGLGLAPGYPLPAPSHAWPSTVRFSPSPPPLCSFPSPKSLPRCPAAHVLRAHRAHQHHTCPSLGVVVTFLPCVCSSHGVLSDCFSLWAGAPGEGTPS